MSKELRETSDMLKKAIVGPYDTGEVTTQGGFCRTPDNVPFAPKKVRTKLPKATIPDVNKPGGRG